MDHERKIATIQRQIDAVDDNGDVADLEHWRAQNEVALRNTIGADSPTYVKLSKVGFTPLAFFADSPDSVFDRARRSGIKQSVALMKAAIGEIELLAPAEVVEGETTAPGGTRVFIVHGHNDVRKLEVASLVRDLTGVKPTILSEYPNQGDTIIEKFERAAAEAAFAIVIASSDDVGAAKSAADKPVPRARQNVILELGYFIGKLGRSRVAFLVESGIERPSDTDGIVYISLDPNGGWKLPLAKELNSAGVAVDFQALAD
ncbi:nucleotide-binding protein [Nocardia farcinica]|uniref:TIR domain-containing protein n=1 Tax=Nocardia farcinica TaxID=37329 RepID=UPI001895D51E|nr:nucleotide-binding protein [Nocardia farcinica]MBF6259981.1 nucleotide-binding protein [Nocardia farcinica]MBF6270734.1 nucleotide-binding protein [Nocardia farcinica]